MMVKVRSLEVYCFRDIFVFVMYYVCVTSGPSLLTQSTYRLYDSHASLPSLVSYIPLILGVHSFCSKVQNRTDNTSTQQIIEALRKYERELKVLKSETADSKKQSTKALKKVDSLEREVRQIRALFEGRDSSSGASIKSRLSSADEGQQVCS